MIVEVGGVRGVVEVAGTGPPLVLLASPLARGKSYRRTAAALAGSFEVYTVEMPGSGRADRVPGGWAVDRYAEWAAGFVDAVGIDKPVVVGHSHSAAVAVVLAARHPERVGKLVVVDATGTGPHPVGRTVAGGFVDAAIEIGVVLRHWPDVVGNVFRHPRNFARLVRDALAADVRADAERVMAPTLIAWGGRDHTLPPRNASEYARRLADNRVHVSPRGSHDWLIARPDEFAAVVTGFARGGTTAADPADSATGR